MPRSKRSVYLQRLLDREIVIPVMMAASAVMLVKARLIQSN
jgi:hypothetical protein